MHVKAEKAQVTDIVVRGTWVGDRQSVDEFGRLVPAGTPVQVEYRHFAAPINWTVKFFPYTDDAEPRSKLEAFAQVIAGEPIAMRQIKRLDFRGTRPWAEGVPADRFATVAEGTLEAPEGQYILELTSDDGVRLWLDDKLLHEDWTHHAPRTEALRVTLGGRHKLRIEHFEIDGYAALKLELKKPE